VNLRTLVFFYRMQSPGYEPRPFAYTRLETPLLPLPWAYLEGYFVSLYLTKFPLSVRFMSTLPPQRDPPLFEDSRYAPRAHLSAIFFSTTAPQLVSNFLFPLDRSCTVSFHWQEPVLAPLFQLAHSLLERFPFLSWRRTGSRSCSR